jgi:hypothetical protein
MGSLYLDRLARVVPPRAGNVRAVACNNATTVLELDNDIFQLPLVGGAAGVPQSPGSVGPQLLRLQADGADLYVLFGQTNAVSANSAAVSGNTQCAKIVNGQQVDFEVSPTVDKFLSSNTQNGSSLTGTLRYWIVSQPNNPSPGSG